MDATVDRNVLKIHFHCALGLRDIIALEIYHDILKVSISLYFVLLIIVIPCLYIIVIKNLFVMRY